VTLPNSDPTRCSTAAATVTPLIDVEMYLVDASSYFDHQLTFDFYSFWREFGLSDFPFNVSNTSYVDAYQNIIFN
jgi:hypothetical protein